MLNDIIFVSENVAIVQSQESSCLIPSTISVQELSTLYGTVSLPIAQSEAIVEDQFTSIKLVFGSWIESGDEETQLEELYRSRLIPSGSLHE